MLIFLSKIPFKVKKPKCFRIHPELLKTWERGHDIREAATDFDMFQLVCELSCVRRDLSYPYERKHSLNWKYYFESTALIYVVVIFRVMYL